MVDLATLRPNVAVTRALQYGLGIFTLTALIGVANATKVFGPLSRDTILAHVHSGTLGWITMAVFGCVMWIYGAGASATAARNILISALATLAYVLAFWSGNLPARAVFGTIELALIVAWWVWVFSNVMRIGFGKLDVPRLAVFLGLTTFVIGSSVGVLIQVLLATGQALPTPPAGPDLVGAHASAQVGGYLVLIAIALSEWRLRPDRGARSTSGVTQIYLLFIGGLCLAIGASFGIQPLLLITNVLYIVAVGIFAVRTFGAVTKVDWGAATPARHFGIAMPFLLIQTVLLVTLVATFVQAKGDFSKVPPGLIVAMDHTMFVGVMTNVLFGTALVLAGAQRQWPWADHLIFWLLNIGVIAFVAVLLFAGYDSDLVKLSAPIMGIGALLGIATFSLRLNASAGQAAALAPSPA